MKEIILAVFFTTFLKTVMASGPSEPALWEQAQLKLELITAITQRNQSILNSTEIYYRNSSTQKLLNQGVLANLSQSQKNLLIQSNFMVKKSSKTIKPFFRANPTQTNNSFAVITDMQLTSQLPKSKL